MRNPDPQPDETVTWSGACQKGLAEGRGVEQWFKNGQPSNRIEGEFRGGIPYGRVVVFYPGGQRYEGQLGEGRGTPTGEGIMTYANGNRYEGPFVDGKRSGLGVFTRTDGRRQDGWWKDGQFLGNSSPGPSAVSTRHEIPLQKERGVLVVPVRINDTITLDFLVDSGASDVSIPADVVLTLYRAKTIADADFLGTKVYRLADGTTVPSETFRIRSLRVGDVELQNVVGSISGIKGSLLLGQSFLSRFGSWSIDNRRKVLVLD